MKGRFEKMAAAYKDVEVLDHDHDHWQTNSPRFFSPQAPKIQTGMDNTAIDAIFEDKVLPSFMNNLKQARDEANEKNALPPMLQDIVNENNAILEKEKKKR